MMLQSTSSSRPSWRRKSLKISLWRKQSASYSSSSSFSSSNLKLPISMGNDDNGWYYSFQWFSHTNKAYRPFSIVLTHSPPLHAALIKNKLSNIIFLPSLCLILGQGLRCTWASCLYSSNWPKGALVGIWPWQLVLCVLSNFLLYWFACLQTVSFGVSSSNQKKEKGKFTVLWWKIIWPH